MKKIKKIRQIFSSLNHMQNVYVEVPLSTAVLSFRISALYAASKDAENTSKESKQNQTTKSIILAGF